MEPSYTSDFWVFTDCVSSTLLQGDEFNGSNMTAAPQLPNWHTKVQLSLQVIVQYVWRLTRCHYSLQSAAQLDKWGLWHLKKKKLLPALTAEAKWRPLDHRVSLVRHGGALTFTNEVEGNVAKSDDTRAPGCWLTTCSATSSWQETRRLAEEWQPAS